MEHTYGTDQSEGSRVWGTMKAGVEQALYQRVSEPEPGRVLVEQDVDPVQNIMTAFIVPRTRQPLR